VKTDVPEVRLPDPAPRLSVVIPCRNEAATIDACLDSVFSNGYPAAALEVIVVDGASGDGTAARLAEWAAREPRLRVLGNPRRTTPAALNLGLAAATGDAVLRLDAHAAVAPGYLTTAVAYLYGTAAAEVGGRVRHRARGSGAVGEAIAAVLGHPFGVGNATFRTGCRAPRWVDTVFGACWRREALAALGGFDERLRRGQDFELNQRLRAAGGKILLVPELVVDYWVPPALGAFARQAFHNGRWAVLPFAFSRTRPVAARHLAPLGAFVLAAGLAAAAPAAPAAGWLLAGLTALYGVLALGAAARGAVTARSAAWRGLAFAVLHASYGAGAAAGCGELLLRAAGGALRAARARRGPERLAEAPGGGRLTRMRIRDAALLPVARGAPADYGCITERPGLAATRDQRAMLATRYGWAAAEGAGGALLEVACGAGLGLGWLAEAAARVVGIDLDPANCALARAAHDGEPRIAVARADALALPFPERSFDTVVLFEALYYLADARRFLDEARRVLRPGGRLLVSSVNPHWGGFAPSPRATRYWSAEAFAALANGAGWRIELWTGFPEDRESRRSRAVARLRRLAARWGLFPASLAAKAKLKRWFYGPVQPLPGRLAPDEPRAPLTPAGPATDWARVRMFYARLRID
jgi:SAM-dependent methyltransferase